VIQESAYQGWAGFCSMLIVVGVDFHH